MTELTLDQFVKEQHERVEQFASWWREQRKQKGPENYPLKLDGGDWDEQLFTFDVDET